MSGYWNTYGIGDGGAWIDRYGNHVDPRTYPDEDALCAAGYRWVDQRNGAAWCARELGDVPVRERAWIGEDVDAAACVEMRD